MLLPVQAQQQIVKSLAHEVEYLIELHLCTAIVLLWYITLVSGNIRTFTLWYSSIPGSIKLTRANRT